jgi:hypothetical protein
MIQQSDIHYRLYISPFTQFCGAALYSAISTSDRHHPKMHFSTVVAMALVPLVTVAEVTSTMTSTVSMTKTITLQRVVGTVTVTGNSTGMHYPTGTAFNTTSLLPTAIITSSTSLGAQSASTAPTASPTISRSDAGGLDGPSKLALGLTFAIIAAAAI